MYKERLKEIRTLELISQKDLAQTIGINQNTYSEYENEYKIIPITHLNNLCKNFNISLDYIFSFTNTKQYKNPKEKIDNKLSGNRLKEFRKEQKLTLIKLASILNYSYGTIAGYEAGRYLISTPFLYELCKKYNISADYLSGKTDSPKYLK